MKGVPLLEDPKHWAVECYPKINQSEIIRIVPVSQTQALLIEFLEKRRGDLQQYVAALKKKTKIYKIPPINNTLIELIMWVTDPPPPRDNPLIAVGKPIGERQKLLGSPGMLELLVSLLKLPFADGFNDFSLLEVFFLCSHILLYGTNESIRVIQRLNFSARWCMEFLRKQQKV